MSPRSESLAAYLRARRGRLRPEDVGFPTGPARRVRGLKREEVAELAGISLEYYTRLEQGRPYQLSEQVLSNLAGALQLDPDAATYFYRLALPEPPSSPRLQVPVVTDAVRHLIDEWSDFALYVFDRNQDILIANDLAEALFPLVAAGHNSVESTFAVPVGYRDTADWRDLARSVVAALRFHAEPTDPRLHEIVGNLSIRDSAFPAIWANHEARPFTSGTVAAFVGGFGLGQFPWQVLNIPGGLFMVVWVAPAGSFAAEATAFLRTKLRAESEQQVEPSV